MIRPNPSTSRGVLKRALLKTTTQFKIFTNYGTDDEIKVE